MSLGAVARGKEVGKAPASFMLDERIGTNGFVVAPEGYPDLLIWLLVVLDVRFGGLLTDPPIFVLLAWKKTVH